MKNKKSTDKKLKLVQQTIRTLAAPELARVIGGGHGGNGAAVICKSCSCTDKPL
jgi:hypothetical protein